MKKDAAISLIRLLSLLAIIICHILQGLNLEAAFWLNIGVQVFLFMSGYLYGQKNIDNTINWYIKQFKKIFIPYFIIAVTIIFIDYKIFNIVYPIKQMVSNLIGLQGFYNIIPTISHTWFVSYILLCYLITPLLQSFKIENMTNKQFYMFLFITFIVLFTFDFFGITTIISAWIFNYILGYSFAKKFQQNNKDKNKFIIIITMLTLLTLIPRIIIQYQLIDYSFPNIIIKNFIHLKNYSHMLLGSWLFIIFYSLFKKIKYHKVLSYSDKYSYCIYLVHQVFILFHMSLLHYTKYLSLNIFIIFLLAFISGIILKHISDFLIKFFSKKTS